MRRPIAPDPRGWRLRVFCASFVVVVSAGTAAGQAQEGPRRSQDTTNLSALLAAAERTYPGLEAREHAIEAASARLDEATLSPYFRFQATGAAGLAPTSRGTPTFSPDSQLPLGNSWLPVVSVGVRGAVPLITFGKLPALRAAARAGRQASQADARRARQDLQLSVRRAYFALQLALDLAQMIREGRPHLTRAVDRLDELLDEDADGVSELDRFRLGSALAEIEARASEGVRLEESSRAALRALTGLERVHPPECPLRPAEYSLEAVQHEVLPEQSLLDAAVSAREAGEDASRAAFMPDIALALSASYSFGPGITDQNNPFVTDNANFTSLTAGLVARINLDVPGNIARANRASAQLEEARALRDEALRGLELRRETARATLDDAARRERAWGEGRRQSRAWFVAAAQSYQVGTIEPRELVDAIRGYFTARFNHLQATMDLNVALAAFQRAGGDVEITNWEPGCSE